VHKSSWLDYVCCCLPRKGPAEDPLEGDNLLAKGRLDSAHPAGAVVGEPGSGRAGKASRSRRNEYGEAAY
jgi:hypothetical protein